MLLQHPLWGACSRTSLFAPLRQRPSRGPVGEFPHFAVRQVGSEFGLPTAGIPDAEVLVAAIGAHQRVRLDHVTDHADDCQSGDESFHSPHPSRSWHPSDEVPKSNPSPGL